MIKLDSIVSNESSNPVNSLNKQYNATMKKVFLTSAIEQKKKLQGISKYEENLLKWYEVSFPQDADIGKALDDYSLNSSVEYANIPLKPVPQVVPNDEFFSSQWALNNSGQGFPVPGGSTSFGTANSDIQAPEGWNFISGGNVELNPGANTINVTARDAAGNTKSSTITVNYNPSSQSPSAIATQEIASSQNEAQTIIEAKNVSVEKINENNNQISFAPPDNTRPGTINNLAVSNAGRTSITLTWTAPGDDGSTGTASQYDIRYTPNSDPLREENWYRGTQVSGEPSPQIAGSTETFTVTGLNQGRFYWFGIKTADEVPNWSFLSNVVSGGTIVPSEFDAPSLEITSPTHVANFATTSNNVTISGLASDASQFSISWANNRGGSGSATGTTNWSASNIPLQSGVNVITITATDQWVNVSTDILNVNYSANDNTLPAVTVTFPANNSTTNNSSIDLKGTATDNLGVVEVSWTNVTTGGGGKAYLSALNATSTNWNVSSQIVAVIDTGIDYTHEDLTASMWKNEDEFAGDSNGDNCAGVCNVDDDADGLIDEDSNECGRNGINSSGQSCTWINDLEQDDDENGYENDIYGYDFGDIPKDADPKDDPEPASFCSGWPGGCWGYYPPLGHGTFVAELIAGKWNNGLGTAGVCPKCKLMALKVFTYGTEGDIAKALQYATDNGARVLNNSWRFNDLGWYAGPYYRFQNQHYESLLVNDIIDYAFHQKDALIVASAGNNYSFEPSFSYYLRENQAFDRETSYYFDDKVFPAAHESVLAVSATDASDTKAEFSHFASWVDAASPGRFVLAARGQATDFYYIGPTFDPNHVASPYRFGTKYYIASGTSFSSAHVSGLAGLVLAQNPNISSKQLYAKIAGTSKNIDPIVHQGKQFFGAVGGGRIDALQAMNSSIPKPVFGNIKVEVHDKATGNGNKKLDLGETVKLAVVGKNTGGSASGITATLSTTDSCITITNATSSIGTVYTWGDFNTNSNLFQFNVSANCLNQIMHVAEFKATFTSSNPSSSYVYSFSKSIETFSSGWPYTFANANESSNERLDLTIVDIDSGTKEIISPHATQLIVLNANGTIKWQASSTNRYRVASVGDIEADSNPEIIASDEFKINIYSNTGTLLRTIADSRFNGEKISAVSLGNFDADSKLELAVATEGSTSPTTAAKLFVFNADGSDVSGWPENITNAGESFDDQFPVDMAIPSIADLDADGFDDVALTASSGRSYAWKNTGTLFDGWPVWFTIPNTGSRYYSYNGSNTPLADLDNDGKPEILAGGPYVSSSGTFAYIFPIKLDRSLAFPPMYGSYAAVGDIDNDGQFEIVALDALSKLHVYKKSGTTYLEAAGQWPKWIQYPFESIVLEDLDGDNNLEIIIREANDRIYAWKMDGTTVGGFPLKAGEDYLSGVTFGDISGDGAKELAAKSGYYAVFPPLNKLHVFTGIPVSGNANSWPTFGFNERHSFHIPSAAELSPDASTSLLASYSSGYNADYALGNSSANASNLSLVQGVVGNAVQVDSESDALTYFTSLNFSAAQGTIEFWVKPNFDPDTSTQVQKFFDISNGSGTNSFGLGRWFEASPGISYIYFNVAPNTANGCGGIWEVSSFAKEPNVSRKWNSGEWHHVGVTWNTSSNPKKLELYIDGELMGSNSNSNASCVVGTLPSTMRIGNNWNGGGQMNSAMDEFRISTTARSSSQIWEDYKKGLSAIPTKRFQSIELSNNELIAYQDRAIDALSIRLDYPDPRSPETDNSNIRCFDAQTGERLQVGLFALPQAYAGLGKRGLYLRYGEQGLEQANCQFIGVKDAAGNMFPE